MEFGNDALCLSVFDENSQKIITFEVMEADIQNIKIELIQWLTTLDDKSLIQKIIDLRQNQTKDWWNKISEMEKASIEKGISDADNGKLNSQSEARKVYEKWL